MYCLYGLIRLTTSTRAAGSTRTRLKAIIRRDLSDGDRTVPVGQADAEKAARIYDLLCEGRETEGQRGARWFLRSPVRGQRSVRRAYDLGCRHCPRDHRISG